MVRGLLPLMFMGLAMGQTGVPPTLESNTVHNNASVPLTAFVYTADTTLLFYDSSMSQYDRPVLPIQSVTIPGNTIILVAAGLFGDGSSFGGPALVTRILHRRQYMIATINRATADMRREMAAVMKKNEITAEFRVTMNRELKDAADEDERDMIQSVRGSVLGYGSRGSQEAEDRMAAAYAYSRRLTSSSDAMSASECVRLAVA
jgi:hypothetical protein